MSDTKTLREALLLCQWISETPHQRGSINGLAGQVEHAIINALAAQAQAEPVAVPAGMVLVPKEKLAALISMSNPDEEPCYEGRGLYDEAAVRRNWSVCSNALESVRDAVAEILSDADDDQIAAAQQPAQAKDEPVAQKCRVCGGLGKVEQFTSAAAPKTTVTCPFCAGDGKCRTPDSCGPHGCHGGCLPVDDASAPQPAQADELRIARGAIRELEAKVFSQEQALAVLRASVDSYHRDMADPPGYLQDAVIKAAGLGAMAERLKAAQAELVRQAEKLTEVERIVDDYGEQLNRQALMLSEAQAERQPLTDEQIRDIVREAGRGSALRRDGNTSLRIARAIERAHGIGAKGGE